MVPQPASEFVLGVASVDSAESDVKQHVIASEAKRLDVLNWPNVARVAVFDELLGNDDRHLANLIRRGLHDYALIDNERIMFGEPWFNLDLKVFEARRCDPNVLADAISETTDEVMRQRMINAAQHLMLVTSLNTPVECESIEPLCGAPPGTTQRLVQLLNPSSRIRPRF